MKKILVVDDQPDNVFILKERLQRENFEVVTAYDGEEGIKKTFEEMPDLILLDVMMPGMSGFEVCRKLTRSEETENIPIIMLTALTESSDIEEGFNAGAYDYVKKPFNKMELIARINSALRFSEANKALIELEKIRTFSATVVTTNHEIKQPLTLINLSVAAIRRELNKDVISKNILEKRVDFIDGATKEIIKVLERLNSVKKPVFVDYVNDTKMIELKANG